jgi:NAD(P)-dependent dehydrogenase (short-subunit alcohol dehydrogenase family)
MAIASDESACPLALNGTPASEPRPATAAALNAGGGRATVVETDVTSADAAATVVAEAIGWPGKVDILVNNVGVVGQHVGREITLADWDMCYEANLKGIWIMSRAVAPSLPGRSLARS